jgi:acyl-CoA synthetase (AMP-forming)/AMP-acid ligase II
LVLPPGLAYMEAVLGGLYAGATIVPCPSARILSFAKAADTRSVITTTEGMGASVAAGVAARDFAWLKLDEIPDSAGTGWGPPRIDPKSTAVLQFTSGSTTDPRGVIITHDNLSANTRSFARQRFFDVERESVVVSWVPMFHDLGLVSMFLSSIAVGCSFVHLSPQHFVQHPVRWMRALTKFRGTHTAGPNFAYELCTRKTSDDDLATLDLKSVRVAMNGAEPARPDTLERFASRFASAGLDRGALVHHYGMAEHTAFVAGTGRGMDLGGKAFSADALARGKAQPAQAGGRRLLSLGVAPEEHRIVIVDAESRRPSPPGSVGEIWVASPSVGGGYFGRSEETEATFRAEPDPPDGGSYLRTGDLGFYHGGELFYAGRLKDTIVLRGENHHPQDVERSVELADPAVRPGGVAAFEIELEDEVGLGIVAETAEALSDAGAALQLVANIRERVSRDHGVALALVAVARRGAVAKTTSGKVKRRATRRLLERSELAVQAIWRADAEADGNQRKVALRGSRTNTHAGASWAYELDWTRLEEKAGQEDGKAWIVVGERPGDVVKALGGETRSCVAVSADGHSVAELRERVARAAEGNEVRGIVLVAAGWSDISFVHELLAALAGLAAERGLHHLVVVTQSGQRLAGERVVSPAQAAVWGACRAMCFDTPERPSLLIDLDSSLGADDYGALARQLRGPLDEWEVAIRSGAVHVPRLLERPGRADRGPAEPHTARIDDAHGVVLDDEELGIRLAERFVERGVRELVLVSAGRSLDVDTATERWRSSGVRVHHVEWPRPHAELERMAERPLRTMTVAVAGLADQSLGDRLPFFAALDDAFGSAASLDFLGVIASAVGVLGAPACVGDAAIAEYAMGIAERRRALGLGASAVGVGPIAWNERHARSLKALGVRFHEVRELARVASDEALDRSSRPPLLDLPFDVRQLLDLASPGRRPLFVRFAAQTTQLETRRAPANYVAPRTALERVLCDMVAAALRLARVGVTDSFFSLGGDSILATSLLAKVNERFGLSIAASQLSELFQGLTVAAIAAVVEEAVRARVVSMTPSEVQELLHHGTNGDDVR